MADLNKISKIITELETLTLSEALELVKNCEEKWGVSAAAAPAAAGVATAAVEEQTEFELFLVGFAADKKISVIKAVKEFKGLELMQAKTAVEAASATEPLSLGKFDKETAEKNLKTLTDTGATITKK